MRLCGQACGVCTLLPDPFSFLLFLRRTTQQGARFLYLVAMQGAENE
jgi:hypothetical protein